MGAMKKLMMDAEYNAQKALSIEGTEKSEQVRLEKLILDLLIYSELIEYDLDGNEKKGLDFDAAVAKARAFVPKEEEGAV